ncbi:retrovirus-related pol polyprotein from transposon TNT 1-94 [Tanacetum coccineum]|uniref:Retrovirus-related pol polyprotein from transposon TNT 1-94 n=1 Tax=Tanacetum coccineum TaxID=301880 RepID=A0ABQ5BNI0_9ASTR
MNNACAQRWRFDPLPSLKSFGNLVRVFEAKDEGSDIGIEEKKANCLMNGKGLLPLRGIDESLLSSIQVVSKWQFKSGCLENGNQMGLYLFWGLLNQNPNRNGNVVAARAEGNENGNNGNQISLQLQGFDHLARKLHNQTNKRDTAIFNSLLNCQKKEAIEEVNANCILVANLQQASTLGTQTDKAPIYESDGSTEVHDYDNCYNNEIFNMFTQIHRFWCEQEGEYKQHPATVEETRAYFESLYNNLEIEVEKVNTVNRKLRETNADLTTELARNAKYDKILYDKAYNDMQQKIERLQAQLGDHKGKSKDTSCVSGTLDPLPQKLENGNVELEFSVQNYEKENDDHKTVYKNLINPFKKSRKKSLVDITTKTRRPQPRSNTKNDRVPSASKSSRIKNKGVEVEEHPKNLLLSKNKKNMSSECNNVKLAIQNDKSKIVCAMCKQCLITANHDVCVLNYVNGMNSRGYPNLFMVHQLGLFQAYDRKLKPSHQFFFWKFLVPFRFGNDHIAAILGFSDLQWGNILITRVYFVEGLGHNLFSVGQFCDSDLEVTFRINTCFVRNLEGVDLLKGNRTTNLYTINLHDMASASPIWVMACATSTKLWLWHQRLSHNNFDTINDLSRNDLITGLPKFKYYKEHLCPSSFGTHQQRLHLLYMDLCGPMRIASINGKWYVLVIVDDYSRYTWVHFLKSKDETPEVIKTFLKRIIVLLQSPIIIVRTDNGAEFKNQVLEEYFDSVGISHRSSSVRTPQQN